ncbi:MAG: hypothetical protein ACTSVI_14300 [Promethearchaeota archaeon]
MPESKNNSPVNNDDDPEGLKVKQIVISAILEALNDIIGPDGKDSIVKFAGLESKYLSRNVRPSLRQWLPLTDLTRLTLAMYRLMAWGSNALLRETGRKFAIFLAPYGYSLKMIADKMKNWIEGDWDIKIEKKSDDKILITLVNDPFLKSMPGGHLWMGFFEVAATNSSRDGSIYTSSNFKMEDNGNEKKSQFWLIKN